jgi:hypothetical protein
MMTMIDSDEQKPLLQSPQAQKQAELLKKKSLLPVTTVIELAVTVLWILNGLVHPKVPSQVTKRWFYQQFHFCKDSGQSEFLVLAKV